MFFLPGQVKAFLLFQNGQYLYMHTLPLQVTVCHLTDLLRVQLSGWDCMFECDGWTETYIKSPRVYAWTTLGWVGQYARTNSNSHTHTHTELIDATCAIHNKMQEIQVLHTSYLIH